MKYKKKLIEVALPLEAINKASAHEKMPGIGPHPRGLHQWWARRPLAAARAVIFSQLVDDPSEHPDLFKTEKLQDKERQRLFKIIEELVDWNNTSNQELFKVAKEEIFQSWRRTCAENIDSPRAKEIFNRFELPGFHDPFSGGGALPVEAQRLGMNSVASDLNPVAVLINKSMVEFPPKFNNLPPVNTNSTKKTSHSGSWKGLQGAAEDLVEYAKWMRLEAFKRIGSLYKDYEISSELVSKRPDLKKYEGQNLSVIAYIWARTVDSPNPAFTSMKVPLISNLVLSTKPGKEAYIDLNVSGDSYTVDVKMGKPSNYDELKQGTKSGSSRTSFLCLLSKTPMTFEYLREQGKSKKMGVKLLAVVAEGVRERVYLPPTPEIERIALDIDNESAPDSDLPAKALGFRIQEYGMKKWRDLFLPRQLKVLTTLAELISEVRAKVIADAKNAGMKDDGILIEDGGLQATAYADAISTYLAFAVDRCADYSNTCTLWAATNQKVMHLFGKQAIAMTWDFPEAAVLNNTVGGFFPAAEFISQCMIKLPENAGGGIAYQQDAMNSELAIDRVISCDPPYYDNIGYADLSDFFYVWLRKSLREIYPKLFSTMAVPKTEELIATPFRHESKDQAEKFFLNGMTDAMRNIADKSHPAFPVTIYYAFKQSESDGDNGTTNTGWDTFLAAIIKAGFSITGTWPMRSEQEYRMVGRGTNALASSIVLVCRPKLSTAAAATRREFISQLKGELPTALKLLQASNIAPVDLAQAAIGPGMAVYTRYSSVLEADGNELTVRSALSLINQILDESLAEQDGDFDNDSRWALTWFEQNGFSEGEYGLAEQLSVARNTSVDGLVSGGIISSKSGKVRLLRPSEFREGWDPTTDKRITAWEIVHQLIKILESDGEAAAAKLVLKLGVEAEIARELCYRLYTLCERKKRPSEAIAYNSLVQSWPEIMRLSRDGSFAKTSEQDLFDQE
ncbi:DUF1156 domain-containing protein [Polynucleobacter paneuropaeus]|nr:DUF1156 domain-containing protein [Polynucleobacter paneuropaeus]